MRLTVFGATGRTGTHVVRQALDAGNEVVAVVRDPARLQAPSGAALNVVRADITDPDAVAPAVAAADAVVSALGPKGTGPTTVCTDGVRAILRAMDSGGARRLVVLSASGAYTDQSDGPILRTVAKPILQRIFRNGYRDMQQMEGEVRASSVDWTIIRPPRLTNGAPKGHYTIATERHQNKAISRPDLATAILAVITDRDTIHHWIGVGA